MLNGMTDQPMKFFKEQIKAYQSITGDTTVVSNPYLCPTQQSQPDTKVNTVTPAVAAAVAVKTDKTKEKTKGHYFDRSGLPLFQESCLWWKICLGRPQLIVRLQLH